MSAAEIRRAVIGMDGRYQRTATAVGETVVAPDGLVLACTLWSDTTIHAASPFATRSLCGQRVDHLEQTAAVGSPCTGCFR